MYDSSGKYTKFAWLDPIEDAESLVEKAERAPKELPPFVVVKGFCTTEAFDADGETIVPSGIDFGPFLREGRLTDGHPARRDNVVGEPIDLTPKRHPQGGDGFYLQGKLYLHIAKGRAIFEQHCGLLKSGAARGLGFSVEGIVLLRDPGFRKRILKSQISSVAIDPFPKNRFSMMEKIMMAMGSKAPDLESLQLDPAIFAEVLEEAFAKALERRENRAEKRLADLFTNEDLMALAYLTKTPEMSFNTAMGHVHRFKRGERVNV